MTVVTKNMRENSVWVRRVILCLCEGDQIVRGLGREWSSLFEFTNFSGQLEMSKVELEFDCFPPSVFSRPGSPENPFWMSQLMFPQVDVPGQLMSLQFFPCIFSIWVAQAFFGGQIVTSQFRLFHLSHLLGRPKTVCRVGDKVDLRQENSPSLTQPEVVKR